MEIKIFMRIGYIRVSNEEQNEAFQMDTIKKYLNDIFSLILLRR